MWHRGVRISKKDLEPTDSQGRLRNANTVADEKKAKIAENTRTVLKHGISKQHK